jgi:hypothetical protein
LIININILGKVKEVDEDEFIYIDTNSFPIPMGMCGGPIILKDKKDKEEQSDRCIGIISAVVNSIPEEKRKWMDPNSKWARLEVIIFLNSSKMISIFIRIMLLQFLQII